MEFHEAEILIQIMILLIYLSDWPGNIRELRNLIERVTILSV